MLKKVLVLSLIIFYQIGYSQVGIGTSDPDPSSILDIKSSNSGILFPRVKLKSLSNTDPIKNPASGLIVYNVEEQNNVFKGFYFWNNNEWQEILYNPRRLGTRYNEDVKLIANDLIMASINRNNSISFGKEAEAEKNNSFAFGHYANSIGENSFAFGTNSKSIAPRSFAIGNNSLSNTIDSYAIGGDSNASGERAYAIGDGATTSANQSYAFGHGAMGLADNSYAIGYMAETRANNSYALGQLSKVLGDNSYALGTNAITNSNDTYAIGERANAKGNFSMVFGNFAKTNGVNAIAIGRDANANADNAVAIGTGSVATSPYSIVLGANADNNYKVGIGISDPSAKLHVNGSFRLTDGSQAEGKVLISDASGKASWEYLNSVQILKFTKTIDIRMINGNSNTILNIPIPSNSRPITKASSVYVTMENNVSDQVSIIWAKISEVDNLRLKLLNDGNDLIDESLKFFITIIPF
ncbi:Head domain of trimeric autotransporter adhesin [Zunongwangia mangrovi]|uniref:Head domain of trimeric autotransporter adhesin n=2 Tax=Zunongwangia mangrovi TaxID=1334022 RepID=A0A1I1NEM2_9FLAO|nr:Head domain of trimeric autotransporter adhesin [Zunongwangia mangrovi]